MSTGNNTNETPQNQESKTPRKVLCDPAELRKNPTCKSATSWLGKHPVTGVFTLFGTTCKKWSCTYCANVKIKRLAWLTAAAQPNRALTLTCKTDAYESPRAAFEATAVRVPEFIRALRKRYGEIEYLRVTEAGKAGYPHYHLLVRSDFLPHAVMRNTWKELTGNSIIFVQKVTDTFKSYYYLTKYLSKMHKMDWTERHVSYSRQFFPEDLLEKPTRIDYEETHKSHRHPYLVLAEDYPGLEVEALPNMVWELPFCALPSSYTVDPAELDLEPDIDSPYRQATQQTMDYNASIGF